MSANNEIGTIQLVEKISEIARSHGIIFHTDAVQAVGHIPINVKNFDMLSASAHKFNAPKGTGFLFIREGLKILPENNVDFVLNGGENRLPGHLSLSFKNFSGETLMHRLDLKNICVATGSACNSKRTKTH